MKKIDYRLVFKEKANIEVFDILMEAVLNAEDNVQAERAVRALQYALKFTSCEESCRIGTEFLIKLGSVDTAEDSKWRVRYIASLRKAMDRVAHRDNALELLCLQDGEFVMVTVGGIVHASNKEQADRYIETMWAAWQHMTVDECRESRNEYLVGLHLKMTKELKARGVVDNGISQLAGYVMEAICSLPFPYDRVEDIPTKFSPDVYKRWLPADEESPIKKARKAVEGAAAVDAAIAAANNWREYKRLLCEMPFEEDSLVDYAIFLLSYEIVKRLREKYPEVLDEHMKELLRLSMVLCIFAFFLTVDRTIFVDLNGIIKKAEAIIADI